jgi:hypothetical protein
VGDDFLNALEQMEHEDLTLDMEPTSGQIDVIENLSDLININLPGSSILGSKVREYQPVNCPASRVASGHKSIEKAKTEVYRGEPGSKFLVGRIYSHSHLVFLKVLGRDIEVGVNKSGVESSFEVTGENAFKRAETYSEECHGKGTGLGFSSFYHLACCLVVSGKNRGVLEPSGGDDVDVMGVRVEITGRGFKQRSSNADWVLNKYSILTSLVEHDGQHDMFF